MKKSTAVISLVVVGSVLTAGLIAASSSSEENTDAQNGTSTAHTGGGHHGGGWMLFGLSRMFGGGFGGRGPAVTSGASARGGFGSFGGMSAAS